MKKLILLLILSMHAWAQNYVVQVNQPNGYVLVNQSPYVHMCYVQYPNGYTNSFYLGANLVSFSIDYSSRWSCHVI